MMSRGLEAEPHPPARWSAIDWLCELVWPNASEVSVADAAPSGDRVRSWWILPNPASPRLLVPVSRGPAARALRQFNDSMSQIARVKKAAVGEALRLGGGRTGGVRRLVVRDEADDLIGSFLPRMFGVPAVEVAIAIGRELRPNLKPVLQVMSRRAVVLGYVKLGWNAVTRELIENEARALRAWESSPPTAFRVPELLHHGTWGRLTLTATSPVPHPLVRRGKPNAMPDAEVLRDVAALHGFRTAPLESSAFVRRLAERLEALGENDRGADGPWAALETLRKATGGAEATLGTWHGDWAPWNMTRTSRGLHVWDWERSGDDVPIGLDAMHFAFEVAYHKRSRSPQEAVVSAARSGRRAVAELGVAGDAETLLTLYLVERFARLEEGRLASVPTDERLRTGLLRALRERG